MNTIDSDTTTRADLLHPTIAILSALALIIAAIVALGAETNVTSDGIFGSIGDYWAQVGEALGP
jgi:hypothetical protein